MQTNHLVSFRAKQAPFTRTVSNQIKILENICRQNNLQIKVEKSSSFFYTYFKLTITGPVANLRFVNRMFDFNLNSQANKAA